MVNDIVESITQTLLALQSQRCLAIITLQRFADNLEALIATHNPADFIQQSGSDSSITDSLLSAAVNAHSSLPPRNGHSHSHTHAHHRTPTPPYISTLSTREQSLS